MCPANAEPMITGACPFEPCHTDEGYYRGRKRTPLDPPVSGKRVWGAKFTARLRITPTTAAVMAARAEESFMFLRSGSNVRRTDEYPEH